jgi:hypothetical protein
MRNLWRFVGLLVLALAGCSGRDAASPTSPPASSVATNSPVASAAKADEAVRRVLDGLRQRKARAVWDFLPPSYREDIQRTIHDMTLRLDEKDWRQFVALVNKARRVLSETKSALLEADVPRDRPSRSAIVRDVDALVRILDVVEESDLSDLQRLQTIDVGRFLDKSGDKLLVTLVGFSAETSASDAGIKLSHLPAADPLAALANVKVTLVSATVDQAIVQFFLEGQIATEYDFVCVEGHWLPKSLADGWASGLAETRRQCLAWADGLREHPESWQARIAAVDDLLDDLASATNAEESEQRWRVGLQKLVAEWLGSPPATSDSPSVEATETSRKPSTTDQKAVTTLRKVKRPDTEVLLPDEP